MLPLRWAVGLPEPLKLPLLTFSSALAVETGFAAALLSNHAQLAAAGGAAAATPAHTRTRSKHDAKPSKQVARHRRAAPANPPRTRPPAGASWVLTSLIREASLGVGLGVVFGAVWSTMQTGPVSKRIVEYYKNNPTQS